MPKQKFFNLSIEETLKVLKTKKEGLPVEEANTRLKRHGPNKLPEKKRTTWFFLLLSQFKNALVYILLGAALISLILNDLIDMYVILAAVLVNVVVGFIQEYKASKAMEKLEKVITPLAQVRREGQEQEIKAAQLVPGDIVILKAGDKVPADGRLLSTNDLEVNEASLTGESAPVKKDSAKLKPDLVLAEQKNTVFLGTVVTQGIGELVVVRTGIHTELGKIAMLIKETPEEKTPFQKRLDRFSRLLGFITLGVSSLIFILGLVEGISFVQIFTTSVAIAVSAIPEGLVVAVTAILAVGMQRILKQKALVKKLVAAETLGSTTVICTDKTGTLTLGDMRVSQLVTLNHDLAPGKHLTKTGKMKEKIELVRLLKIGVLSNDAVIQNPKDEFISWKIFGNPTERSLLLVGAELGFYRQELEKEEPRLDEVPFDSEKKYMLTLHRLQKRKVIYLKGAPEKVLKMSKQIQAGQSVKKLDDPLRKKFQEKFEEMSKRGLRILAFAYQRVKSEIVNLDDAKKLKGFLSDYIFVGFVAIKDPLRPETKETIKLCKKAGLNVVMITGDHRLTAQAIAQELGLKSNQQNILEGKELQKLSHKELARKVKGITVYARVTPKDKLQIIDAWQEKGEVVAMTGDGVNDAPALKAADIGIAVGSGSDVAKETSDMVILDDNFRTIVAAVEQGRIIFDNIKKVVLYLLSDSFAEILLITSAITMSGFFIDNFPLPLLASQILWINLIDDSFPAIALTFEPGEREVMEEKPSGKHQSLFVPEMKVLTVVISLFTGFVNFFLFWYVIHHGWSVGHAQTLIFANLGIDSLIYVFSVRSMRHSVFSKNILSNRYLLYAVGMGVFLQLTAVYFGPFQKLLSTVPLVMEDWLIIILSSILNIGLIEITKYIFILKKRKSQTN